MKTSQSGATLSSAIHKEYRIGDRQRYVVRRRWQIRERTRQMPPAMLAATTDPQRWPPIVFWRGVLYRRQPCHVCLYKWASQCWLSSWLVR